MRETTDHIKRKPISVVVLYITHLTVAENSFGIDSLKHSVRKLWGPLNDQITLVFDSIPPFKWFTTGQLVIK